MSMVLRPDKGVIGRSELVQLRSIFDARCSDSFAPGKNNLDYQGGNSKWAATFSAVSTALNFDTHGLGYVTNYPGGIVSRTATFVMDNVNTHINQGHDFIISADFFNKGAAPTNSVVAEIKLYRKADNLHYWIYQIRYNFSTSVLSYYFSYNDPAGPGFTVGPVVIAIARSGISPSNHRFNMQLSWSKRVQDMDDSGIGLYLNGYLIAVLNNINLDMNTMGNDCVTQLLFRHNGAPGAPAVLFTTLIRNFSLLPYILYGDGGAAHSYISGINTDPNRIVLHNSRFDKYFTGWPITAAINTTHRMTFSVEDWDRSGNIPISAVMPMSNTIVPLDFEYVMKNRKHNNPFINKAPIMMVDGSLNIGDKYTDCGAVYDADADEYGIEPIMNTEDNESIRLPSQQVRIINASVWPDMSDGSGDDLRVNTVGNWHFKPIKKITECSSKMMNESSYGGVIAKYSELGSEEADGSGNNGWPISCDRSPSSPFEFYGDSTASTILMESALRFFRFAPLPRKNTDRHKGLFVAWKENAAPSGTPEEWDLDLVIGRMLSNNKVEIVAPFGVVGYRVVVAGLSQTVMHDLPQDLGQTAPVYRLLPDLAIIPIGEPGVTDTHRIYYLKQGSLTNYHYAIGYVNISDSGEIDGVPGTVVFEETIYNPASIGVIYDSVLQFDIIQPMKDYYILVAVLGNSLWAPSDFIEDDVACVMFDSVDGINFRNPRFITLDGLRWTPPATTEIYSYAYPSLSYTVHGPYAGEVLLGITQVNGTSPTDKFKTGIFSVYLEGKDWTSQLAKPWSLLVPCNETVAEETNDDYTSIVLGAAAFRDRIGKLHVAINKIAYGYGTDEDYYGAMYYLVFDGKNRQYQFLSSGMRREQQLGQKDIVSLNRFAQHNRTLTTSDQYNTYCLLRPHFSVCDVDGYLTFNAQYDDSLIGGAIYYTDKGRDIVYRLFDPTDLGELYPPGPAWNYAMGRPVEGPLVLGANYHIWRKENWADADPTLASDGLDWAGPCLLRTYYKWFQSSGYDFRLPVNTIAVKCRFKHNGVHAGLPIDYANLLTFSITFRTIVWGRVPTAAVGYSRLDWVHFFFNEDSVALYVGNAPPVLVWSRTSLDFNVFRDIYIIGWNDSAADKSYWNIYMERVPDGSVNVSERWMPKTFILLNDEPIEVDSNTTSVGLPSAHSVGFGGYVSGLANPCGTNSMVAKYFQVYHPMYKAPGNEILRDSIGAKIDGLTSNTSCMVGGATFELAQRHRLFGNSSEAGDLLCPSVFQTATSPIQQGHSGLSSQSYVGYGGNRDMVECFHGNVPLEIDVGNNTSLLVQAPDYIPADTQESIIFKYGYQFGIDKALDSRPFSYWGCKKETATVRICFDSQAFKDPLDTLAADCLWLLNTNLINVRIKANNIPAAWGAAPFEEYLSFIVDNGIAVTVAGIAGIDQYLIIEDTTKNWIPNQFVNEEFPYHVIAKDPLCVFYGGKIVKNTQTRLWYQLSTRMDTSNYSAIIALSEYSIVAPSVFHLFDAGEQRYRYWALEILPGDVTDYQYFCDGLGKICEIGLGMSIPLNEYGDPGYTEKIKNMLTKAATNVGRNLALVTPGRLCREFSLLLTNIDQETKYVLLDIFRVCEELGIPMWFLPTSIDVNDIVLCDFANGQLTVDTVLDNYLDADEHEARFKLSANLKQRI